METIGNVYLIGSANKKSNTWQLFKHDTLLNPPPINEKSKFPWSVKTCELCLQPNGYLVIILTIFDVAYRFEPLTRNVAIYLLEPLSLLIMKMKRAGWGAYMYIDITSYFLLTNCYKFRCVFFFFFFFNWKAWRNQF